LTMICPTQAPQSEMKKRQAPLNRALDWIDRHRHVTQLIGRRAEMVATAATVGLGAYAD
jgi:hypothetical protein